jgi:hypothetical protein
MISSKTILTDRHDLQEDNSYGQAENTAVKDHSHRQDGKQIVASREEKFSRSLIICRSVYNGMREMYCSPEILQTSHKHIIFACYIATI